LYGQTTVGYGITVASTTSTEAYDVRLGHGVVGVNLNVLQMRKGKLELNGSEAQFVLPNYITGSIPATNVLGGLVYDTTTNELKVYDAGWNSVGGLTPPGGSTTELQYNNAGAFGGTGVTWDGSDLSMATGGLYG